MLLQLLQMVLEMHGYNNLVQGNEVYSVRTALYAESGGGYM